MKKYRIKGAIVNVVQWNGDNLKEVIEMMGLHPSAKKWTWEEYEQVVKIEGLKIFTEDGAQWVQEGSFIVGVGNRWQLYRPDTFKLNFEKLEYVECKDEIRSCVSDVINELESAIEKFAKLNSPHEAYAVIQEEVDEFWDLVKKKQFPKEKAKKELTQIAAMALRAMVELCSVDGEKGDL